MPKDIAKSEVGYWNTHVEEEGDNSQLWGELNKTAFMCNSINHLNRWVAELVKSTINISPPNSPPNSPPTSPEPVAAEPTASEAGTAAEAGTSPMIEGGITPEINPNLFNLQKGGLRKSKKPKKTKKKKKGRKKTPKRFY